MVNHCFAQKEAMRDKLYPKYTPHNPLEQEKVQNFKLFDKY